MSMSTSLFIKFFGVFIIRRRSSIEALQKPIEKWPDHLQWNGGRYISRSEINEMQIRLSKTELRPME
jgi:hypothetical protein